MLDEDVPLVQRLSDTSKTEAAAAAATPGMLRVEEGRQWRGAGTVVMGAGGLSCWLQHWKTEQKEE